jgi:pyruvate,water dikinase
MAYKTILWFNEISAGNIEIVGGKGLNLGLMANAGFPIPPGFVVTAQAYFDFLEQSSLKKKIVQEIDAIDSENTKQLEEVSEKTREMIRNAKMPDAIAMEIKKKYLKLSERRIGFISSSEESFVAVRSSATAEDLAEASFAGQQETYLNVQGKDKVVEAVQKCWASLFTARAVYYRRKQGFSTEKVGIAVVVQKMVESTASGIMFTADPVGDETKIIIEAGFGLGEAIVSGSITPDNYVIDKNSMSIVEKHINFQEWKLVKKGKENFKQMLVETEGRKQKLDDSTIMQYARIGMRIENYYKKPQDIEFALEGKELFIVQSRAITTLGLKEKAGVEKDRKEKLKAAKAKILVSGLGASPGIVSGRVRIVPNVEDAAKVEKGDILVTKMTSPDWVPTMKKSIAIVTNEGGSTCHAAIISRELGIPCVVGTRKATEILEDNETVTVNGFDGVVYEGKIEIEAPKSAEDSASVFEKKEVDAIEKVMAKEIKKAGKEKKKPEENPVEKEKKIFEIEKEEEKEIAEEFKKEVVENAKDEVEEILEEYGKKKAGEMSEEELKEEEEKIADVIHKTAVKVKVNVALPDAAVSAAKTNADGVGLLRAEHMITAGGKHPAEYLREGKQEELTAVVKEGIKRVAVLFKGKPVWYRTFDARTDEFRHLEGGSKEPEEDNPMLGWHGIRRDLDEPELLKAQFFAIQQLLIEGIDNVGIMLPFVQSVEEVKQAKKIAKECGLNPSEDVQFGVMVETPAACWIIDDLIEEGIDFISFGTNDLTQLTLGLDRNNERIQKWFSELHPAILKSVNHVIQACRAAGVTTSICGQAGSNPEMVKHLIHFGIDSVSANIDAVEKIRKTVLLEEKKMMLENEDI